MKLAVNEDSKERVAMKVMNKKKLQRIFVAKNKKAYDNVMGEIAVLKKLEHPNVTRLIEILDDPNHHKLYLCMEYVAGGDMLSKL